MVKSPAGPGKRQAAATSSAENIAAAPTPGIAVPPPAKVVFSTVKWSKTTTIHRVHLTADAGDQFNLSVHGNARFSPIRDATGNAIPTLYGGSTFDCAVMETVFHDVPFDPGLKTMDKAKLYGQVHSEVMCSEDLLLADFGSKALRKLGIARNQMIDTEKEQYPVTRQWAEAVHRECPDVQGICWTSRQDDSARALIVFGDRVGRGVLKQAAISRNLVSDPKAYRELLILAEKIGVDIVPKSTPD